MADDFDALIPDALDFLTNLAANNTRDWFADHKNDYEIAVKAPATAFGAVMAADLRDLTGVEQTPKLFRVHRDVRFSKDKTPYNTHLHLLWSAGPGPGWFFGVAPDYVTAGCGVMAFDKPTLTAYRAHIDAHGAAVQAMLDALTGAGFRLDAPALKRVPPPFDKDHPHGVLLRRKGLALWHDVSGEGPPRDRLKRCFEDLMPVYDLIRSIRL